MLDTSSGPLTLTGSGNLQLAGGGLLMTGTNAATLSGFGGVGTAGGGASRLRHQPDGRAQRGCAHFRSRAARKIGSRPTEPDFRRHERDRRRYFNDGTVQAAAVSQFGASGTLNFAGGTLVMQAGTSVDFGNRISVQDGGGALDVSQVNAVIDGLHGPGAEWSTFTIRTRATQTAGFLTITGTSTFRGTVIFDHNLFDGNAILPSVVLNGATNAVIAGNLQIGSTAVPPNNNADIAVALGADEQIVDTATLTMRGSSGENPYFMLGGHTETIAGLIGDSTSVVFNRNIGDTTTTAGTLIIDGEFDTAFVGLLRDNSSSTVDALPLNFVKRGVGVQLLSGASIYYSGSTTIGAGATIRLQNTTSFRSSSISNSGTLIFEMSSDLAYNNPISGSGSLVKTLAGTLTLGGANSYSGQTIVNGGTLSVGSTIGNNAPGNSIKLSEATLRITGNNVVLGANQSLQTAASFARVDVQGNSVVMQGGLFGPAVTQFEKLGSGRLTLTAAGNFVGRLQLSAGALALNHPSALGPITQAAVATGTVLELNGSASGTAGTLSFTGSGNVLTLGTGAGDLRLGFGILGATNDKFLLGAGQTLTINATNIFADIFINSAPTLTQYTLLETSSPVSFAAFQLGTIVSPGSFLYTLDTSSSTLLRLNVQSVATPSAAYWKGGLGGAGAGVWAASLIGGNTNWTADAGGTVDTQVLPAETTDVFFSAAGAANFTTTLGANLTIKSLTFLSGSGTPGNGVTVGGSNVLTIAGVGGITLVSGLGTVRLDAPLGLGANQNWTITDAADILDVRSIISGTGNLTKLGPGILALSGTSTFTGRVIVGEGTLRLSSSVALGGPLGTFTADQLFLAAGTTLENTVDLTFGDALRGTTIGGANVRFSTPAGTTAVSAGPISGTFPLIKTGLGTLRLTASSSFTGGINIQDGTLQFTSEAALGVRTP
ncbi:MAG: autotransporter-associated beta strand repeat-containing protein [Pirellulales bacterium]